MEIPNSETDVFKKPTFMTEKSQKSKPTTTTDEQIPVVTPTTPADPCPESPESSKILSSVKPSQIKTPTQPIPYSEPSWGGKPDVSYSLEVGTSSYNFTYNMSQS